MWNNIKKNYSKVSLVLRGPVGYLVFLNLIFINDTKNKVGLFIFILCMFIYNTYLNYSKLNVMLFVITTLYMIGYLFVF